MLTRRALLQRTALGLSAAVLPCGSRAAAAWPPQLVEDPGGLLDLPRGFSYRVVQSVEDRLSDGSPVPGNFDGMAAFPSPDGGTVLVRNHELKRPADAPVEGSRPYRAGAPGGTTGIVVDPVGRAASSFTASSGTIDNCAGGRTPWGTWITCEEERTTHHGHCFEVDPRHPQSRLSRRPIRAMGTFSHEAVAVDPGTGIVYLTEDDHVTRTSFLYRFIPEDRSPRPGSLHAGGKLQALALGEGRRPSWRAVRPEQAHADALARGCARFVRLEGCCFAAGSLWFDDTAGGPRGLGRVYRYRPRANRLELFLEGNAPRRMERPDNMVMTPWGDLWFAEDGSGSQRVVGITPGGRTYAFARNRLAGLRSGTASELAGPCFSPDGGTFFVNVFDPGHTLAITGPFPRPSAARTGAMALAPPQHAFAPAVTGELAEVAAARGLSPYEVAAQRALGFDPA